MNGMTISDFLNGLLAQLAEFFKNLVIQILQGLFPNPTPDPNPTQN